MAIGRSEDRDTPWSPLVLRHRYPVWDPIRVTHLGQRSFDRTIQAGHMTATDQAHLSCYVLARRGPSTYVDSQRFRDGLQLLLRLCRSAAIMDIRRPDEMGRFW